jgi:flagellar assembly factor FliW
VQIVTVPGPIKAAAINVPGPIFLNHFFTTETLI